VTDPQPLEDLSARLDRERRDADRSYNDALTRLEAAIQDFPRLPAAPRPPDSSRLPEINHRWNILPQGPPDTDNSIKGRLRALLWRVVGPPIEAQREFNALLVDHVNRSVAVNEETARAVDGLIESLRQEFDALVRFESLLVQYLQTITAYVDTKDRSASGGELRQRLAAAEQRMLGLKRAFDAGAAGSSESRRDGEPVFSGHVESSTYVGFEDRFRGTTADIRSRVEDYVPLLASASDVVDIGCGRGELLSALKARGVGATGVDANPGMVEACRSQGLIVEQDDALAYLERQDDGSIGGLVAIQVVEHFDPAYLMRFLEAAYYKMRAGAPLVLETINPSCWMAFFETYIRDLTHRRPLHPDTLSYLVQASGFGDVNVQFRQPVREADRLERVKIAGDQAGALPRNLAQIADALNSHADKLNARLFSSMDYAVIGRR
jgi:O-antigen chain-terminating methyltransferase